MLMLMQLWRCGANIYVHTFVKGQNDALRRISSDTVSFKVTGSEVMTGTL